MNDQGNRRFSECIFTSHKRGAPGLGKAWRNWPISEDHCFQRIDHICGGVWYEYLDRPAYKSLTKDQAQRAVKLCQSDIANGHKDLQQ